MNEKYIVNDLLESISTNIRQYENFILESSNIELRQILQNVRNSEESFQYEILKLAKTKGYYTPPENVDDIEIRKVVNCN